MYSSLFFEVPVLTGFIQVLQFKSRLLFNSHPDFLCVTLLTLEKDGLAMYSPYGHYLRPYFKSISTSDSHSGAGWKASDSHSVSFDPNNYAVGIDPNSYDVSLLKGGGGGVGCRVKELLSLIHVDIML